MKNKLVVLFVVVAILLAAAVVPAWANGDVRQATAVETDWVEVAPLSCYQFYHELGYMPLDVHAWVKVGEVWPSATKSPFVTAIAYADFQPDGEGLALYTGDLRVSFCNFSTAPLTVKITAE